MRDILKRVHEYVPGHQTENPIRIISSGDLLTCAREIGAQENVRDCHTPSDRRAGLMPVIADFHLLGNHYEVDIIYHQMLRMIVVGLEFRYMQWRRSGYIPPIFDLGGGWPM